ncbi:MAG: D-2-hydroxyacid dehydrogenase [Bacteroidota bacterium]|jgi:glycerate dehydrogenase
MNIVVLDGYTMNPGDLGWSELQSLGTCTIYDRTSSNELFNRAQNAEIILTNKVPFPQEVIIQFPRLKYIGATSTGYNIIDIAAAKEKNIVVTNVPAYSTHSVAQLVFGFLLELSLGVSHHSSEVHKGRWSSNPDFAFWDFPLVELRGKTFGIIGFGNIGKAVAKIANAFEMKVLVSTRYPETSGAGTIPDIVFTDVDTLLKESDVISLHCALTPDTKQFINTNRLSLMKPTAYLINTGRGALVDEQALADALNTGTLAGAGLDVLSTEPPQESNPLLTAKNCIITPHIAWASQAARKRLMDVVVSNIRSFIEGKPVNVVS